MPMKSLSLVLLVLFALSLPVLADTPTTAQDNNPRTNRHANACYIGGSLYGKCETYDLDHDRKVDIEEVKYMYDAGWFVIRFEEGMILRSQVPRMYRWLIGPEPIIFSPGGTVVVAATTCEIYLTGPIVGAPTTLIIPLNVINGGVDPNGIPNNPYGFDWGTTGRLNVVVPGGGFVIYDLASFGGWYAPHVASTTCPTPVPPA
jgi:hypothetical protein